MGRVWGAEGWAEEGDSSTALLVSLDAGVEDVSGAGMEVLEALSVALKELEGGEW